MSGKMVSGKTALVIGATGGVGGAIAERLVAAGWRVRAMNRNPDAARLTCPLAGLDWVQGDAMVESEVVAAAAGVDVIVHGANPPGYRNWRTLAVPMLASSIAAAKASGARLVFPGNVYNFGPDAFDNANETSPQNPRTRKGKIRVEMENSLRAATAEGARVLIVRCGDFFGPHPGSNWLSQGLVTAGKPITAVRYPGPLEVDHAWAWLPDVAETVLRLLEDPALGTFEVFHMRGHTQTGHALVEALEEAAGRKLKVGRMPWFAMQAVAPFVEMLREMMEMRYLWDQPVRLDNTRLVNRLGVEPHTPLAEALREALVGMGALAKSPENIAA